LRKDKDRPAGTPALQIAIIAPSLKFGCGRRLRCLLCGESIICIFAADLTSDDASHKLFESPGREEQDLNRIIPPKETWKHFARTGLKFYTVGAAGIAVQLAGLTIYHGFFKWNYLLATALAVEGAVLHNFVWHERWTWRDHADKYPEGLFGRLIRFNLANGTFSIIGNVLLMRFFVGVTHLHYFLSNILSIGSCSLLNFLISHRFIYSSRFSGAGLENEDMSGMQT
jgi:putative flippase GtrA